ncbi:MAG: winged helix-turn-helix domain-containing protein [Alphaproteobacteria bacterium]|nr:winged helix-turn-helix domain-containing protein [Alphaproteobacteria bacterium]
MVGQSDPPAIIELGNFRIFPHRRQLLADGRPIALGGRAFDLLTALIEASGGVVSKDQLLSRVWPDRVVEETRLHGEISALRKTFGADRPITNLSKSESAPNGPRPAPSEVRDHVAAEFADGTWVTAHD